MTGIQLCWTEQTLMGDEFADFLAEVDTCAPRPLQQEIAFRGSRTTALPLPTIGADRKRSRSTAAPTVQSKWICLHCTFENSQSRDRCAACQRPPVREDEDGEVSISSGSDMDSDTASTSSEEVDEANINVAKLANISSCSRENLEPAAVPPSMTKRGDLLPYQLQGLSWMLVREEAGESGRDGKGVKPLPSVRGGIVADVMGLGKTRSMIALCESTHVSFRSRSMAATRVRSNATLVVCPVSIISQWVSELKRTVAKARQVCRYHGANRSRTVFELAAYDYVFVSYHTLASEQGSHTLA